MRLKFLDWYLLVWSGGSSTTKDSVATPEISFVSNGILVVTLEYRVRSREDSIIIIWCDALV